MNAKILAAGAALVLSLAACSDEPETPPTTTEPTTEEPAAEEPTTDEVSRVVTEYVVKDAASYNYLESLILPALEDEIDHMTTMTFPAMERLEVPGV